MAHDYEKIEYSNNEVKELFNAAVHTGTVVSVDKGNDKADVNIDGLGTINDIPIFYHCPGKSEVAGGALAFSDGDNVYVLNKEGKVNPQATDLKIVGFVDGLQPCGDFVVVSYSTNGIKRCFVWDTEKDQLAEFKDNQGDPITFPCNYADIESFLGSEQSYENIVWDPISNSNIDCDAEMPPGCDHECYYNGESTLTDDCAASWHTPNIPGFMDSVTELCRCHCTYEPTMCSSTPCRHYAEEETTKDIHWHNFDPGYKATHEGFIGYVRHERISHENELSTALWDDQWAYLNNHLTYDLDKTETHKTFVPIKATPLTILDDVEENNHSVSDENQDWGGAGYTFTLDCDRLIYQYNYKIHKKSVISDDVIVNIFFTQYIAERQYVENSEGTPPPPHEGCVDPATLPKEYPAPRAMDIAASIDYFLGGTEGENPFAQTVNIGFSAEVKTLIEDYYIQAAIPATELGSINLNVNIH